MTAQTTTQDTAEAELTGALLALSRVLVAMAASSLAGLDEEVTLPQFRMLVLLASRGPQRVGDLSLELSVTSSTATRMCNRLERKGLIARQERPTDRRAAWITLTRDGWHLVGTAMERRRDAIAALVEDTPLARPYALTALVNALVESAGDLTDPEWRLATAEQRGLPWPDHVP